jgi:hypothetical protein
MSAVAVVALVLAAELLCIWFYVALGRAAANGDLRAESDRRASRPAPGERLQVVLFEDPFEISALSGAPSIDRPTHQPR